MVFLQSYMLLALPLIALPVLIHLINQHRHRTVHWAATRFLLQAKRMARGMARLQYLLILLARMLAIGGLIFAVARPMAAGWLGLASGAAPELTVVILDRSVSMEQQHPQSGRSKREAALDRISEALTKTGRAGRIVVFETATGRRLELASAADLPDLPEASATETAADMPAVLLAAVEYIEATAAGRVDVWICSDLRQTDWNPGSGLWSPIQQQLATRSGVRVHVLAYPEVTTDNLAVSVSNVRRRETAAGAELVLDIRVTKSDESVEADPDSNSLSTMPRRIPVTLELAGARSTLELQLNGAQAVLNGHTIPVDRELKRGWGRIELPRDQNLADNSWPFVFAEAAPRRTWIVSTSASAAELLRLAAGTAAEHDVATEALVVSPEQATQIDWDSASLVIWQAPLPVAVVTADASQTSLDNPATGDLVARQLETFVADGGSVLFYPPDADDQSAARMFGTSWGPWKTPSPADHFAIQRWRQESDLLANSESGMPLPVSQLLVYRCREVHSERMTVLAQLEQGPPLLMRISTDHGQVWFCSTLPDAGSSNLATNGITFYVMVQRALSAAQTGAAMQLECGPSSADAGQWNPLDQATSRVPLSQRQVRCGVFERSDGRFVALHRPISEDSAAVLSASALDEVLQGIQYTRIDDSAGRSTALVSEVWRAFLATMLFALLTEAALCVPSHKARSNAGMVGQRAPGRPAA